MKENENAVAGGEELERYNAMSRNNMIGLLGIEYTYASDRRAEATMPVNERTVQPFGFLHGGASLTLAETLAGFASQRLCAEGEQPVGQEISASHVRPVPAGNTVRAVAVLQHKGRNTHIWNVEVLTSGGELVSTVRVVNFILRKGGGSGLKSGAV